MQPWPALRAANAVSSKPSLTAQGSTLIIRGLADGSTVHRAECHCDACRGRVAQLDRAFGYEPKGRGFESSHARHLAEC